MAYLHIHLLYKKHPNSQVGTFDDETKGIAGGKLLVSSAVTAAYRPPPSILHGNNMNGDTRMIGVNKMRIKWVS